MLEAKQNRPVAGVPPWLVIALVLLAYKLPYMVEMLRADIDDFKHIDEAARVQLAVEEIEDVRGLSPVDRIEIPSPDRVQDWLEPRRQKEEERRTRLRDWLMGGACPAFAIERLTHSPPWNSAVPIGGPEDCPSPAYSTQEGIADLRLGGA